MLETCVEGKIFDGSFLRVKQEKEKLSVIAGNHFFLSDEKQPSSS